MAEAGEKMPMAAERFPCGGMTVEQSAERMALLWMLWSAQLNRIQWILFNEALPCSASGRSAAVCARLHRKCIRALRTGRPDVRRPNRSRAPVRLR